MGPSERAKLLATLTIGAAACGASDPVREEIAKSGPGLVTVVEFVDYDCRFCKEQHERFQPMLEEQRGAVRVVLKHVPSEKHPNAKHAAIIAICAEAQGKAEPIHDALMGGAGRSDEGLYDLVQHAGLELEAFKACMRSDAPLSRIEADIADYHQLAGQGLPMLYIGEQRFVGLQPEDVLAAALREAAGR